MQTVCFHQRLRLARAKCLFSFRGIAGGARGSDIGEIVGMGVGAAVGAAIGEQADKKAEERSEKRRSPYEQQPTDESGFDENNGGDDCIFDFNGTDYTGNYSAQEPRAKKEGSLSYSCMRLSYSLPDVLGLKCILGVFARGGRIKNGGLITFGCVGEENGVTLQQISDTSFVQ